MFNPRQSDRAAANDDKKFDFTAPDNRTSERPASHRYFPVDGAAGNRPATARSRPDDFSNAHRTWES